jgi:CubicO group peptidase (beta-lactamase class C family)
MHTRLPRRLVAALVLVGLGFAGPHLRLAARQALDHHQGMSAQRLMQIGAMLDRHIAAGAIPGAVSLVARKGQVVHFEARGFADLASKRPMARDTVFELFSMTKPVVAVAVLILVEEGRIGLNEPIGTYVPAYQRLNVVVTAPPGTNGSARTEPAARPITVGDVLTHTSGLVGGTLDLADAGAAPATDPAVQRRLASDTLADYIPRMAAAPLRFQPGTRWAYSGIVGFDLLARVVEVASGKPFDQFLRDRIFVPLKMSDTAHNIDTARTQRLATRYQPSEKGLQVVRTPYTATYFGGGWGLKGTAADYLRFAQMLLNRGTLDGVRVMSPRAVELLARAFIPDTLPGRVPGEGYGLGVRVVLGGPSAFGGAWLSEGSYGWEGAAGTCFFIDPKQQVVGIVMTSTNTACGPPLRVRTAFEAAVMQAIVE